MKQRRRAFAGASFLWSHHAQKTHFQSDHPQRGRWRRVRGTSVSRDFFRMGAKESLAQAGYSLHAVLTIGQLLDYWEAAGKVERDKIEETRKFLEQT